MRVLTVVVIGVVAVACREPIPQPSDELAAALEAYAPSVRLGRRAPQGDYRLVAAPYVGYADTTYQSSTGFGTLYLAMEDVVNGSRAEPSRWARVLYVSLASDDPAATEAARVDLTRRLGAPRLYCTTRPDGQIQLYYWPDETGRGAQLNVPIGLDEAAALHFGPEPPDADAGSCEADLPVGAG